MLLRFSFAPHSSVSPNGYLDSDGTCSPKCWTSFKCCLDGIQIAGRRPDCTRRRYGDRFTQWCAWRACANEEDGLRERKILIEQLNVLSIAIYGLHTMESRVIMRTCEFWCLMQRFSWLCSAIFGHFAQRPNGRGWALNQILIAIFIYNRHHSNGGHCLQERVKLIEMISARLLQGSCCKRLNGDASNEKIKIIEKFHWKSGLFLFKPKNPASNQKAAFQVFGIQNLNL